MSITTKFAAAAVAVATLGAAISFASIEAQANTTAPAGHKRAPGGTAAQKVPARSHWVKGNPNWTQHCYWLPTIANGTVTGLHQVCNWVHK